MTTVQHQSHVPGPARLTRVGNSSGSLYINVPGAGRVPLGVRRIDPQKLQDHEKKVQDVWAEVKSQIIGAKNVKVSISKLFVSFTDAQGKTQYIDLGAKADPKYANLQRLVEGVRSSVSDICDCFKWKAKGDDASNRPIGTERPFSSETSPKKLCESQKQFMTDGSFERLTECVDELEGRTSADDKVKTRMETQGRIQAADAFIEGLQANVDLLIQKEKKERQTKKDEKKDLDKQMNALNKEIKSIEISCNQLAAKANLGDATAQAELGIKTTEKQSKETGKANLQKQIDDKADEIEVSDKKMSQLEQLKQEIKEVDRYACYWAVGVGNPGASKEDRLERAKAITENISNVLSTKKVGFFGRTSLEESVIKTYAKEVGDLVITDRLEYIERSESLNIARESAGLMPRSERGSSVEGLVAMAAINGFDETKMNEVSQLAGFSRFEKALQTDLIAVLEKACSLAKPKLAAPTSSSAPVATAVSPPPGSMPVVSRAPVVPTPPPVAALSPPPLPSPSPIGTQVPAAPTEPTEEEFRKLRRDKAQLEGKIDHLRDRLEALPVDDQDYLDMIQIHNARICGDEKEKQKLEVKLGILKEELDACNQRLGVLSKADKDHQPEHQIRLRLSKEIEGVEKTIHSYERRIAHGTRELAAFEASCQGYKVERAQIQEEFKRLSEQINKLNKKLQV